MKARKKPRAKTRVRRNPKARHGPPGRRATLTARQRKIAPRMIREELAHGRPRHQAVAIGLARARSAAPAERSNPHPGRSARIERAVTLYQRFTGHEPRRLTTAKLPLYGELMRIGTLIGVAYEATRDGETARYYHEFRTRRPMLAASWDGRQLYIIGGAYEMTDEGIVG
ncbi:MAG: hypothetical protein ACYCUI_11585 [Vulcanimicrobiaceae bacterium]